MTGEDPRFSAKVHRISVKRAGEGRLAPQNRGAGRPRHLPGGGDGVLTAMLRAWKADAERTVLAPNGLRYRADVPCPGGNRKKRHFPLDRTGRGGDNAHADVSHQGEREAVDGAWLCGGLPVRGNSPKNERDAAGPDYTNNWNKKLYRGRDSVVREQPLTVCRSRGRSKRGLSSRCSSGTTRHWRSSPRTGSRESERRREVSPVNATNGISRYGRRCSESPDGRKDTADCPPAAVAQKGA